MQRPEQADAGQQDELIRVFGQYAPRSERRHSHPGGYACAFVTKADNALMNLEKRRQLLERIAALNALPATMPVVPLETFFDGNDDQGSIGCNLGDQHPGIERFHRVLATVKKRADVQDVLVGIYEADDEDNCWPFSETVYVITSAPASVVSEWLSELLPDEVEEGLPHGPPPGMPALQPGMRPVWVWWD